MGLLPGVLGRYIAHEIRSKVESEVKDSVEADTGVSLNKTSNSEKGTSPDVAREETGQGLDDSKNLSEEGSEKVSNDTAAHQDGSGGTQELATTAHKVNVRSGSPLPGIGSGLTISYQGGLPILYLLI